MTVLASLSQYFKFSESAEKHRDAALGYETILNELSAVRRRGPGSTDESFADIILAFDNQYMKVKTNAPMLSEELIKKHSSAERDLFNSVHAASLSSPSDVESAVRDQINQIEVQALHTEETAERLRKQVAETEAKLDMKSFGRVTLNGLRHLAWKLTKQDVRSCLGNWRRNTGMPSLRDQLAYEKEQRDKATLERLELEREILKFKDELERASREGVMKAERAVAQQEYDKDSIEKLRAELVYVSQERDRIAKDMDNLRGEHEDKLHHAHSENEHMKALLANLEEQNKSLAEELAASVR